MFPLFATSLFALIVHLSSAAAATIAPGGMTEGTLSCVELEGNRSWSITPTRMQLNPLHYNQELKVKLDLLAATKGPVNVEAVPKNKSSPALEARYLGVLASSAFPGGLSDPKWTAAITMIERTEPLSPPTAGDEVEGFDGVVPLFETGIWRYDPNTHELKAQWFNDDGSTVDLHVLHTDIIDRFLVAVNPARLPTSIKYFSRQCRLTFTPV